MMELRELIARANPLPWDVYESDDCDVIAEADDHSGRTDFAWLSYDNPNSRLIVAAVNSLPQLLDELVATEADLHQAIAVARERKAEVERLTANTFRHYWLRDGDRTNCCGSPAFTPAPFAVAMFDLTGDLDRVTCPWMKVHR